MTITVKLLITSHKSDLYNSMKKKSHSHYVQWKCRDYDISEWRRLEIKMWNKEIEKMYNWLQKKVQHIIQVKHSTI